MIESQLRGARPAANVAMANSPVPKNDTLYRAAQELEATFLSEMLKSAGLDGAATSFGGGVGEEQFTSYLRQEHARAIAARGGIGLAEHIYAAMEKSHVK